MAARLKTPFALAAAFLAYAPAAGAGADTLSPGSAVAHRAGGRVVLGVRVTHPAVEVTP